MFTLKNASAIATLAGLIGCTSIIPYAPPATRPEARVRIVVPNAGHIPAQAFGLASGACDGPIMDFGTLGASTGANRAPIGMMADPSLAPGSYMERRIPAGKPYLLFARVGAAPKACGQPISFRPEADADYQATFSGDATACSLVLTRLGTSPEGSVIGTPEPTAITQSCTNLRPD